jgi:NAD(P)-dependent dehydrogenase (short-subunit alcohol dehydrogenase family)
MSDKNWTAENIPNQKGKVAIVTGSSSGIGFEAARVLAEKQATVIIAVRNLEKGNKALEKILAQNKEADVKVLELDLANLESVKITN